MGNSELAFTENEGVGLCAEGDVILRGDEEIDFVETRETFGVVGGVGNSESAFKEEARIGWGGGCSVDFRRGGAKGAPVVST